MYILFIFSLDAKLLPIKIEMYETKTHVYQMLLWQL
jgi:hypothetical protein